MRSAPSGKTQILNESYGLPEITTMTSDPSAKTSTEWTTSANTSTEWTPSAKTSTEWTPSAKTSTEWTAFQK